MITIVDSNTYIKLFRSALDSQAFQDPMDWKVFSWCLLRCTYIKRKWKGEILEPGQFVTSYRKASEELDMCVKTTKAHLDRLCDIGSLKLEPKAQYTKITVLNFKEYQAGKYESVLPNSTPSNTHSNTPSSTHRSTRSSIKQESKENTDKSVLKESKEEPQAQLSFDDTEDWRNWDFDD